MPTAVESYAKLGAVVVHLPANTANIHVDPNNSTTIPGRSGPPMMLHQTTLHVTNSDDTFIGGRNGTGSVSILNPHLPPQHPPHHQPHGHVHAPHPPHGGAPLSADQPIGGRTGVGTLLPAVKTQVSGRESSDVHAHALLALLRPIANQASNALLKILPASAKTIEVIGLGTTPEIIAVLIGLLRDHGFHATIASCDGSVRPGFAGSTAVLRSPGTSTVGQFLQQLVMARH